MTIDKARATLVLCRNKTRMKPAPQADKGELFSKMAPLMKVVPCRTKPRMKPAIQAGNTEILHMMMMLMKAVLRRMKPHTEGQ